MIKLNNKLVVLLASFLVILAVTACNNEKEQAPVKETKVAEKEKAEEVIEEEVKLTLAEQGFVLEGYDIDPIEGVILMRLEGPEGEYHAMMDSNFEWVIEPQREIVQFETAVEAGEWSHGIYFSEGLIRAAVKEDRGIRASRGRIEEYKWGYLNTSGEWVIEPKFRRASIFSDGVAIVTTIEEDRDDLSNARQIVIDQTGKEKFELVSTYNLSESPEEDYEYRKFTNGYLQTEKGIIDTAGSIQSEDIEIDEMPVSEYEIEETGEEVIVYNPKGEKVATLPGGAFGVYSNRYWIEGNEYDKMLTFDGQVIIDEDKKVVARHNSDNLKGKVVRVDRRINAEDPELTELFLNTITFDTISIDDILNQ